MKYITIATNLEASRNRKTTTVWDIRTSDGAFMLGQVKWFSRWRKYAFFPEAGTLYEERCMRDIADWCEASTKEHRRLLRELKDLDFLMSGMFK